MSKLTRSRIAQIVEILDQSLFTSAAFDIISDEEGMLVSIRYRDDPQYYVRLFYDRIRKDMFGLEHKTVLCMDFRPGDFTEDERHDEISFDSYLQELRNWTQRLRSEIVLVNSFQRQFEQFQAELNAKLEKHFKDPKERFSPDEREELSAKLREFEARIEELSKENQITQEQMKELRRTVADLTQASQSLPKRAWHRTACSKLFSLMERILASKSGQKVIEITIDRLLEASKHGTPPPS